MVRHVAVACNIIWCGTAQRGALSALDFFCHHHGGPLGDGDLHEIEDLGTVIVCPSHGRQVSIATGAAVERSAPCAYAAAGQVQRVHDVRVPVYRSMMATKKSFPIGSPPVLFVPLPKMNPSERCHTNGAALTRTVLVSIVVKHS